MPLALRSREVVLLTITAFGLLYITLQVLNPPDRPQHHLVVLVEQHVGSSNATITPVTPSSAPLGVAERADDGSGNNNVSGVVDVDGTSPASKPWLAIELDDLALPYHRAHKELNFTHGFMSDSYCIDRATGTRFKARGARSLEYDLDALPESVRIVTAQYQALKVARSAANHSAPPVMIYMPQAEVFLPVSVVLFPAASHCRDRTHGRVDCDIHCHVPCRWTTDHRLRSQADAVQDLFDTPSGKLPNQTSIIYFSEPQTSGLMNARMMSRWDLVAHWHRGAHVKLHSSNDAGLDHGSPFNPWLLNLTASSTKASSSTSAAETLHTMNLEFDRWLTENVNTISCRSSHEDDQRDAALVFVAQDSDLGERTDIIRELSQYVMVASYGTVLNNRIQPEGARYVVKRNLGSQYRFCLAIENHPGLDDWVTEKVFDSFASGCVPIYYGAPNIQEYLPCSNCIIDLRHYESIRELAQHLIWLDRNEHEYQKYLAWKQPGGIRWPPILLASKLYVACALCEKVSDIKRGIKFPKLMWFKNDTAMGWRELST